MKYHEVARPGESRAYYCLYVILDIYSRNVVGWMLAIRETAALAEVLIEQTCLKQRISRGQPSLHADRGSSMTSKPVPRFEHLEHAIGDERPSAPPSPHSVAKPVPGKRVPACRSRSAG